MAAQPDAFADPAGLELSSAAPAELRPAALVLPLNRVDAHGHRLIDEASGGRLGAARGLFIGLALGGVLWLAIGLLAWSVFRH